MIFPKMFLVLRNFGIEKGKMMKENVVIRNYNGKILKTVSGCPKCSKI
jgi:hypothetical protein